ncbi:MAG: 1-deoxy-D-xylulose-5-phosphate reductoisomerase [Treponema sp.]|jgi:1-deoxy-D-xylulose-5-phosphate reductoisomerase|nr:1-deoxy-D-xylulose-5-phosphate reductoisomerase [Treponema sp.]
MKKKVALLGATGSVGKNTLDVLREGKDYFEAVLFSGHTKKEELLRIGREFPGASLALSGCDSGSGEIGYYGREGLLRAIGESGADIAVNGINGAAGLEPSMAVIEAGASLALANKETVVMAGPLVFAKAREKNVKILPADSEHSAIFNLTEAHGGDHIAEVILTASGGPFRTYTAEQLSRVTPRDALVHPNWKMGPKITVDCASLANKGLEVIESVELFGLKPEQITVAIHPQSVVHSMVRLSDGAVYAQLSEPDMRLPIHDTLYWPLQQKSSFGGLSLEGLTLSFEKPNYELFPMLPLAFRAVKAGGLYPAAYNAANETAVEAFLELRISFLDIPRVVEYALERDWQEEPEDLKAVLDGDLRARRAAGAFIARIESGRGK